MPEATGPSREPPLVAPARRLEEWPLEQSSVRPTRARSRRSLATRICQRPARDCATGGRTRRHAAHECERPAFRLGPLATCATTPQGHAFAVAQSYSRALYFFHTTSNSLLFDTVSECWFVYLFLRESILLYSIFRLLIIRLSLLKLKIIRIPNSMKKYFFENHWSNITCTLA